MLKKLTIATWPIEKLKPYERNPRKNDAAVDRMCKSIQEFGFPVPILAKRDGEVIDGHLRLKAAVKLGLAEVPVIVCDGWSAAQVKAFRLMVNRSVTWADWDIEALGAEFLELKALDFDLTLTGFELSEITTFTDPGAEGRAANETLSQRFGVPPFSVLDARQGYWQDRKRAWLALGIQSELGRGGGAPGGSPRPAAQLTANGRTQRGDGIGRAL